MWLCTHHFSRRTPSSNKNMWPVDLSISITNSLENSSETRQTKTISEMTQKLAKKGAQFAKPLLQLG